MVTVSGAMEMSWRLWWCLHNHVKVLIPLAPALKLGLNGQFHIVYISPQ